jgi:hypothetical protein
MNVFLYYLDKMTSWLSFSWVLTKRERKEKRGKTDSKYELLLQPDA